MTQEQLTTIQAALRSLGVPAWLLYNFRESNPIAIRALGFGMKDHMTRRWALLVPAEGTPRGLAHRIEPHIGAAMPGNVTLYSSYREFEEGMRALLNGFDEVAMEYSSGNAIPVVSKVDAGTVELVRSLGVEVVSSGNLVALLEARLSGEQIESARRAGAACREVMMSAFKLIRDRLAGGERVTEYDVVRHILDEFERRDMITDHPPNCSVGANGANPHYQPTAEGSREIREGDYVLIDLWARENREGSVYGDITWVGYAGTEVPERYRDVFTLVRDARDAAFERVREGIQRGEKLTGAELDDAARAVIESAGYGEYFTHRTGHSITTELHGAGANLDNFETQDTRSIIAGTSFSIEPGIYLPGEFGIRSELDVVISLDGEVSATSEPLQREVVAILSLS